MLNDTTCFKAVYIVCGYTDLRSGMDRLAALVEALLTEISKHLDDTDRSFLDDLLPWSPNLPANCRKPSKEEVK